MHGMRQGNYDVGVILQEVDDDTHKVIQQSEFRTKPGKAMCKECLMLRFAEMGAELEEVPEEE